MKYSIFIALISFAALASAQDYSYSTFDPPGSTGTIVTGMNNAGQIVGSYTDAKGTHNFLRSADGSSYTTIDLAGAVPGTTTIGAINNLGQIAGTYLQASNNVSRCYIANTDGSSVTPFDIPNFGPNFGPHGLNDLGAVSGAIVEASASSAEGFVRAPDGTFTVINVSGGTRVRGINNSGSIAGWTIIGGSEEPVYNGFLRSSSGQIAIVDLPGTANFTTLAALNNQGQLTGSWGGTGFVGMADGSYRILSIPGVVSVVPGAIDDHGRVAGSYNDGATNHGFIATPAAAGQQPQIRTTPPGVISASGFGGASTAAPGTWIEIYGENLSTAARPWALSDFNGTLAPTSLGGVTVSVNGIAAVVSYVSPGQVNAFLPPSLPAGPAAVTVSNGTLSSSPYSITINAAQPSLLVWPLSSQSSRFLAAVFPDFATYVLPSGYTSEVPTRIARPGDTIVLLGMGLGPVNPPAPPSQVAPQASPLQTTPLVSFNNTPATVIYAGLVAGTIGLYQINVVVPEIVVPPGQTFNGTANVTVQVNGVTLPLPSGALPTFLNLPVSLQ